jgi:hypothetical protein
VLDERRQDVAGSGLQPGVGLVGHRVAPLKFAWVMM